jgi:hypothetical protein
MVEFRARLPKEEAAVLLAALNAAKDLFGPPPAKPDRCGEGSEPAGEPGEPAPGVGTDSNANALLDVARGFLDTAPEDRSGEDRTLVVVHVSAENLSRSLSEVPTGTPPQPAEPSDTTPESMQMPAEPVEASLPLRIRPKTFPRERLSPPRRSVTSRVSARWRLRPRKNMPVTARCWVRWSTNTAKCSP